MSALHLRAVMLALAATALATGCSKSRDDVRYPAGWSPLVATNNGCPADLDGTWRVDAKAGDLTGGIGVLATLGRDGGLHAAPAFAMVNNRPWTSLRIQTGPAHALTLEFRRQLADSAAGGVKIPVHAEADPATCDAGMVTIAHNDTPDGAVTFRLGRTNAGELVAERLANEREVLLRWGDTPLLKGGRRLQATWDRWQPGVQQPVAVAPTPAATTRADASPFVAASTPFKAPTLPLPAAPATRPGALPMGEAQAIVLGALPDNAVFLGMTPTPRGYSLRASGLDAQAMTQLSRRLAIDGHFTVQADAPAAASGASTPAPAREAGGDVTLELIERLVH